MKTYQRAELQRLGMPNMTQGLTVQLQCLVQDQSTRVLYTLPTCMALLQKLHSSTPVILILSWNMAASLVNPDSKFPVP